MIDALAVVEKLRVTHPRHFATLVRIPATFHRIHYKRHVLAFVYVILPCGFRVVG